LFLTSNDDIRAADDVLAILMQFFSFAINAKDFILRAFLLVAPVFYLEPSLTLAQVCITLGEPFLLWLFFGFHISVYILLNEMNATHSLIFE
jgi:hypothetical protein